MQNAEASLGTNFPQVCADNLYVWESTNAYCCSFNLPACDKPRTCNSTGLYRKAILIQDGARSQLRVAQVCAIAVGTLSTISIFGAR